MTKRHILGLIGLTVAINVALLFSPFLSDTDPTNYFVLAKNMVLNGHWLDLIGLQGGPWLDKPHFPFWVTAVSFELFGYHAWSYLLPGFLFYMLGAVYTFKLARFFYHDDTIAWLSVLIMLTSLHLMLSTLDLRAEAYLIGEIMPACYYWLKYNDKTKMRYLLLGALFTGFALMTKGPFVLVTIGSGIIALWVYQKQFKHMISIKWLAAAILSLVCATPEFIALYAQFGIKGLQWYFYGSQFGRFFDTGTIVRHAGGPLFFSETFLWAFLPWSAVFVAALMDRFKNARSFSFDDKKAFMYLASSFFITFIMFSVSKFQLDHYTNIIFPFAAILSARYLYGLVSRYQKHPLFTLQIVVSIVSLIFVMFLISVVAIKVAPYFMIVNLVPIAVVLYMWFGRRQLATTEKAIAYPALSITAAFLVLGLAQAIIVSSFSAGYIVANYINRQKNNWPVYEYREGTNVSVYVTHSIFPVNYINQLPLQSPYYLVLDSTIISPALLKQLPKSTTLLQKEVVKLATFNRRIFLHNFSDNVHDMILLQVQ